MVHHESLIPAEPDGYNPIYCARLIEHLQIGLSIRSFVGVVGEDLEVIETWIKRYPEFAKAFKIGEARALMFYEQIGIDGMKGDVRGFNGTAYKLTMEARFNMVAPKEDVKQQKAGPQVTVIIPDNGRQQPRIIESQVLKQLEGE